MPRHNTSFLVESWRVSCLQHFRFLRSSALATFRASSEQQKKNERSARERRLWRHFELRPMASALQLAERCARAEWRGRSYSFSAHSQQARSRKKTREISLFFFYDVARRSSERESNAIISNRHSFIHCAATRVPAAGEVQFLFQTIFSAVFRPKLPRPTA